MIHKKHRMSSADHATFVPKKVASSDHFILRYNTTAPHTKIAVTVSKKKVPHAVVRNTIKRRIKAVLKNSLPTMRITFIGTLSTKKGIEASSMVTYKKEITHLLKQI